MATIPPQNPNESARAYEAFCQYAEMGAADRSVRGVAQRLHKSNTIIGRWSREHDWVERCRAFDQSVAADIAQAHTKRYLTELEAHRKKSMDAGQALYSVAGQLIKSINYALANPKKIEGKDGKFYTIHSIDLTASTFQVAARAMTTALDLEAHALGVDDMLGKVAGDDSE